MVKKKADWHLFWESDKANIDELFAIYKENPREARIIFDMNNKKYVHQRVIMFTQGVDFQIAVMARTYGISTTNRIYSREVCVGSISYSKGRFYRTIKRKNRSYVEQLTHIGLQLFINEEIGGKWNDTKEHAVYQYLIKRFSWIRFLDKHILLSTMPFNVVVRHKLYSYNGALRYMFKAPMPVIRVLMEVFHDYNRKVFKVWKEIRKVLLNVENLGIEMATSGFFMDSCKMAELVGRKINCSWGLKRLRTEHDKWAKEITLVMLKYEKLRDLTIERVYLDFAAYSGYKLFLTNHELIGEGVIMNHCVGTYTINVDQGICGIYHVDGHTLDLRYDRYPRIGLHISQLRGFGNMAAPNDVKARVNEKIAEFNEFYDFSQIAVRKASLEGALPF